MDHVVIAEDLSARVSNQAIENVIGLFGEEHINRNGVKLQEFGNINKFRIVNSFFFRKRMLTSLLRYLCF